MQGPKHAYLASALAFLSMCAIGDGVAVVKASVTDERGQPYRECRMELLSIYNKQVLDDPGPNPYPKPQVVGTFITTFILPPILELYLLRIACKGSNETFTSEPIMLPNPERPFPAPVDLGIIQLKRH